MYLKNIEVQGFKSFANKINFEFHNGITGIVGPNGSGKSNVADAVRWVLGEQRIKQLRGAKMEDVIFAGTENRKPLGYAYVAITLDNSDHQLPIEYDEVTVSRRLFRSGESEYLINGSICRLKDISELFYDTGIGKEGYSIIGQGQIDKILSGKPEERRELFDEAAGIVKFKKRKIVAQRKLEDEQNNLVRVNDILSELEKQVKPLEKQSEIAKKYLSLKSELKEYDINMFLLEVNEIREKLNNINEKIEISDNDLNNARETYENIKKDFESLELKMEAISLKIEEKKNELNRTEILKEKFDGEIRVLNEQINSVKQNDEHIKERIYAINENIDKTIKEKEGLLVEKNQADDILKNADSIKKDELEKLNEISLKIQELVQEVEDSKNEIIDLLNEKSSVKSKIQRYDTMLEQIHIRKAELNQKLLKSSSDKEAQENIIRDLENELEGINNEIINNSEKQEELEEIITSKNKEKQHMSAELNKTEQNFHVFTSKLESLKNITERYEGFGNSIKKVMELKTSQKGIIGVVADIIKTDKEYEIAIETALGGNIQNIVTDTENTAKNLIEYLKKGKFGRATFLPLSSLANRTGFNNERVLSEKGVIGLASDLVKIKKEFEAVAKYLLGRIVVADNIDNAIIIARKYNHTLRIVTLDGELLNPGGSMTGGAFKNSSNLLGRRREIEDLEKNINKCKEDRERIHNTINSIEIELAGIKEELDNVKAVLQEQYLLQNTVKMNLNQADSKKQEILDLYQDFEKETLEMASQISEIKENSNELTNELKNYENLNAHLEEKINEISKEIEEWKEKENIQNQKVSSLNIEFSNLKQKNEFINSNLEKVDENLNNLYEDLKNITSSSNDSENEIKNKENEIDNIKKSLAEAANTFVKINEEIEALVEEKNTQSKEHKDFFSKREAISEQMNTLDKEMYRLNSQREKLEEQNENQVNYMWNEYELTYQSALEFRNEELTNLSQIKKTISTLKSDIRGLGDVNVNAIEEYKEVVERYNFLKTQHDDLVKAEETLQKIIKELDEGMRKQFSEKFELIRSEFDKVFKELFGGGKGTIELNEDEDILEAGISIISQPPGKKLQNMMQLSGGEKALTAIALLFAIQNLKPSPFCLLDEIEAALDDSNVGRYANYLHKLTKHTQFIVITHRKGTMTAADRLYGITMQEKGVSTLVSVDLLDSSLTN
ncbi:MAG: chromosome segregation protein SMC [Lachnospiraceae bacterium]|nr:chromosome segregation protein SMC [Lachnospiraceae bacterium]